MHKTKWIPKIYKLVFFPSFQHALWAGGIWWVLPGEWSLPCLQQSRSALLCKSLLFLPPFQLIIGIPTFYSSVICCLCIVGMWSYWFLSSQYIKLSSIKVDTRYTTTQQVVKLIGSHTISKVTAKIGDLKRTKMVRTINLYYNNRTVQAIVELKNKYVHPCFLCASLWIWCYDFWWGE